MTKSSKQQSWRLNRAGQRSKRHDYRLGKLGPASACRRISPQTGEVIEEFPAKFRREYAKPMNKPRL